LIDTVSITQADQIFLVAVKCPLALWVRSYWAVTHLFL